MGVARPLRTHLGLVMPLGDKAVYAKAGVRHFKQYICKAEAADLVDVGGTGPNALVVAITASASDRGGGQFTRRATVALAPDPHGKPWRVLAWSPP